jgi:glycosyltransferase involved in cell wall biosynthesis
MRIAQIVTSYHPQIGGVETHVQRLAQGCARVGDTVTVFTHQVDDSPKDEVIDNVRVRRFPLTLSSQNYPLSLRLFDRLRSAASEFDVAHVHSYHTLVGHAAIGSGLPVVFTSHYHGTGHTALRAFLHRLYRPVGARLFTAADAVICVSEAERDLVLNDFPQVAGKIFTVPNGIDPKLFSAQKDRVVPDEPVVLTVGRLERYKNVDLIIDAFRALPSSATLVIVGDGPDRARLEQCAEASKPGWPVLFTGRIPDPLLDRLFAQARVITSASDHEAFGLTLADGLAAGARVVASAIPAHVALAQLAGADAPVALVNPRDTKGFSHVLAESLSTVPGTAGQFKLPSWAEVVERTREVYSQVLLQGCLADRRGP